MEALMKVSALRPLIGYAVDNLNTYGIEGSEYTPFVKCSELKLILSASYFRYLETRVTQYWVDRRIVGDYKTMERESSEAERAFNASHPELNP